MRQVFEEIVPFNRVLGLKIESIDPEAPKLRFDMRPDLVGNPLRQILHGGVISAVLDVTAGLAIMLALLAQGTDEPGGITFPNIGTIDLRVDYLRPGRGKHFIATGARGAARQPHRGRAHGARQRRRRPDRHRRRRLRGGVRTSTMRPLERMTEGKPSLRKSFLFKTHPSFASSQQPWPTGHMLTEAWLRAGYQPFNLTH